ncbi:MAG: hypothetical protein FWD60_04660 [Candidatus Azobacteroides sp.]|nr:hypothetical protein [Candidatus Azobacteroides sp.]
MKTIKEAVDKYIKDNFYIGAIEPDNVTQARKVFKAGVEFAQRWIDVKDELPETTMETIKSGNYIYTVSPVLIKTSNGRFAITKRKMFMDHGWYWMGSSSFNESVEYWRPIELK